jgi:hypothetical protein
MDFPSIILGEAAIFLFFLVKINEKKKGIGWVRKKTKFNGIFSRSDPIFLCEVLF